MGLGIPGDKRDLVTPRLPSEGRDGCGPDLDLSVEESRGWDSCILRENGTGAWTRSLRCGLDYSVCP